MNSDYLDGLDVAEAKATVISKLEESGHGKGTIQYKLRDWLFARQRYWGEPFPIVYDAAGNAHALPDSALPVVLPEVEDYAPVSFDPDDANSEPSPRSTRQPTGSTSNSTSATACRPTTATPTSCRSGPAARGTSCATSTPPTRTRSVIRRTRPTGPARVRSCTAPMTPVESTCTSAASSTQCCTCCTRGSGTRCSSTWATCPRSEPYRRLYNQGYIQAFAYTDARGVYVPAEEVVERDGKYFYDGAEVNREYGKMGKSLKNAVAPDEICAEFGADTLRVYEMSMGPLDTSRPWATKDVVGASRFLQRVWRVVIDEESGEPRVTDEAPGEETLRALNKAIAGVSEDYTALRDNTAAAKLIEYNNHLTKAFPGGAPRSAVEPLVLMLAPLAPHLSEELWSRLGHTESLAHGPFPAVEEKWLVEDTVEYPIQVNGKVRSRISVPADADRKAVEEIALADEKIVALLEGNAPRKVIVVPGKMVNIVL